MRLDSLAVEREVNELSLVPLSGVAKAIIYLYKNLPVEELLFCAVADGADATCCGDLWEVEVKTRDASKMGCPTSAMTNRHRKSESEVKHKETLIWDIILLKIIDRFFYKGHF